MVTRSRKPALHPSPKLTDWEDRCLRSVYRERGLGIDAYSRCPGLLEDFVFDWAERANLDPETFEPLGVLRYMEHRRKHSQWVQLRQRRSPPRRDQQQRRFAFAGARREPRRLTAAQQLMLRELFDEIALPEEVAADGIGYQDDVCHEIAKQLNERTGVLLEPLELRGELIAMRKRGELPTQSEIASIRLPTLPPPPDPSQLWLFDKEWTDTPAIADRSPDCLFASARQAEQQGDADDAVARYRRLLRSQGPSPLLCFNLGNALLDAGRHEAAAERFVTAVELDPSFADAWHNLAICIEALRVDDWDGLSAEQAYREALAANPALGEARLNLADLLDRGGQSAEAIGLWEEHLRLDPAGADADHARRRIEARRALSV